jgi:hypothetical protein
MSNPRLSLAINNLVSAGSGARERFNPELVSGLARKIRRSAMQMGESHALSDKDMIRLVWNTYQKTPRPCLFWAEAGGHSSPFGAIFKVVFFEMDPGLINTYLQLAPHHVSVTEILRGLGISGLTVGNIALVERLELLHHEWREAEAQVSLAHPMVDFRNGLRFLAQEYKVKLPAPKGVERFWYTIDWFAKKVSKALLGG